MRIQVDVEKCCGCRICEVQCSFHHTRKFNPRDSRIHVTKIDNKGFDYPQVCHQCNVCPPASLCPTKAFAKEENGSIRVQRDKCIRCHKCGESCSYSAVEYDSDSNPLLCDLCSGTPICVERCPTNALTYTEGDEPPTLETAFKKLMKKWNVDE